jgi:hypothetical protein
MIPELLQSGHITSLRRRSPVRLTDWGFERNGDPPRIVGEYSAYTDQAIDQGYRAVQELLIELTPKICRDCQ